MDIGYPLLWRAALVVGPAFELIVCLTVSLTFAASDSNPQLTALRALENAGSHDDEE